jgi:hypothetical protein
MELDPKFSLQNKKDKIEKLQIKVAYDVSEKIISIGTIDDFYSVGIKLPIDAPQDTFQIKKRTSEVVMFVKEYFLEHPEELHKLGYQLAVAIVNSAGTTIAFNAAYVAQGTGAIRVPYMRI